MATHAHAGAPFGVIVNTQTWLPLTQRWIFSQARYLPKAVTPYVVCGTVRNLDQFAIDHLFSYSDLTLLQSVRALAAAAPKLGLNLTRRSALMAQVATRFSVRVAHSHFGYTGYQSAGVVKKLGLKHVVTFYGADMSALPAGDIRWLDRYRALFADVDRVLCEGPRMADSIRQLGCPAAKVQIHHLGVNLDALPFRPRRWQRGQPLKVLIAASFREKKGIPYAIDALAELKRVVPIEITIVGDASDDPKSRAEKERILAAVERGGLASTVRFMGYRPHAVLLEQAYGHHVFLSPSVTASDGDSEGGAPVSLIEMAATGMPIVSTRHADIPEVIEHGAGGLLAAERDVEGLVAHLRSLVEAPDTWESMAAVARARVEREFDATTQGERLTAVYRELS